MDLRVVGIKTSIVTPNLLSRPMNARHIGAVDQSVGTCISPTHPDVPRFANLFCESVCEQENARLSQLLVSIAMQLPVDWSYVPLLAPSMETVSAPG